MKKLNKSALSLINGSGIPSGTICFMSPGALILAATTSSIYSMSVITKIMKACWDS